ncbi:MAG: type II toxin-antitoxin system RelE/ParE family toxin [Sedimentisphaerales bacterium]|nr:type II toxin-antitoxin system RelE/ParE family toxin [Sedimentisphaerales bacterium]
MKIVWTETAVADLEAIHSFIARDSEYYASGLVLDILDAAKKLENFPRSGRIVPEINDDDVRELIFGNYRLIYHIAKSQIQILTLLHGACDMQGFEI